MIECPKCNAYLREMELVKTNLVYAHGSIPVEYDAQCPRCGVDMGKVLWGKLELNPALKSRSDGRREMPGRDREQKRCPHCGRPLPDNY